jgi:hypothetical protein
VLSKLSMCAYWVCAVVVVFLGGGGVHAVIVFGPVLAVAAAGLVFGPAAKTGGLVHGAN